MSATTIEPRLDISGSTPTTLGTLVRVELRKMADTRAGKWLLIAIVAITAVILTIGLLTGSAQDHTFQNLMGLVATPQGILLPVLGILLVTQEWGQRTGMVTFTLAPDRRSVIGAKVIAAILFGLAAVVIAIALGTFASLIGGAHDPFAGIGADDLGKYALLQVSGILQGLAFGLLLLNSAAAIVAYFVVPIAFSIVANVWTKMHDIAPWVDLGTSQPRLYQGHHMTGEMWAQLGTSSLIWIIVPFAIGLWRVLRAEVK